MRLRARMCGRKRQTETRSETKTDRETVDDPLTPYSCGLCSNEPCPPEEELRKLEIAAMVIAAVIFVSAYLAFVSRPVTPELDWLIARAMQGIVTLLSGFVCFGDAQGDVGEGGMEIMGLFTTLLATGKWAISKVGAFHSWWKRNQAPQFLKILITYFQVS